MNKDLCDVTIVLDRSGSMQSCREEAENGLNHFIDEQKKTEGECVLTLVQFDTEYEFVHTAIPVKDVPRFTLVPRGMTALLDAVGRAINEAGDRLSKMDEEARPGLVAFVILTDGLENSSHEFTKDDIKKMIERQQSEYGWQFTFLGANQNAFAEAAGLGISKESTAQYNTSVAAAAFAGASFGLKSMRSATSRGQKAEWSYSPDQRRSMT